MDIRASIAGRGPIPKPRLHTRGPLKLLAQLLRDLITGTQSTEFCWKNEIQSETPTRNFSILHVWWPTGLRRVLRPYLCH
jgi:hypothetical protein